jgi:hypothetical protein
MIEYIKPMATPKKFIRDHYILLLLTVNIFLCIAVSIFILVRLSDVHSTSYIVQCRNCSDPLATNKYLVGGVGSILSLIAFSIVILAVNSALSYKAYTIHRQLSVAILSLGILLQILTLTVSNSLLVLR